MQTTKISSQLKSKVKSHFESETSPLLLYKNLKSSKFESETEILVSSMPVTPEIIDRDYLSLISVQNGSPQYLVTSDESELAKYTFIAAELG